MLGRVPSLGKEYTVFRETFFAHCFLACLREFIRNDGVGLNLIVHGVSEFPIRIPEYVNHWTDLDENLTDKICVKVHMIGKEKTLHEFVYNISEFIGDYDYKSETSVILEVFRRIAEAFQKDYIKWWMENNSEDKEIESI